MSTEPENFIVSGTLHSVDFDEGTITLKVGAIPSICAGYYVIIAQRDFTGLMAKANGPARRKSTGVMA